MSMQGRISRAGGTRVKRALGVQAALEWAFPGGKGAAGAAPAKGRAEEGSGFGLEYVLMQRAALGCKVDGGQYKMGGYTHADAEVIAATVAGMPDSLGGKRMAIRVVELARAGLTPDWMPGAVPRCVPVEMKRNRHGDRAVTEVVGTERVQVSGKWRTVEVRACPVRFSPDSRQIEAARRAYGSCGGAALHPLPRTTAVARLGHIVRRLCAGNCQCKTANYGCPSRHNRPTAATSRDLGCCSAARRSPHSCIVQHFQGPCNGIADPPLLRPRCLCRSLRPFYEPQMGRLNCCFA